MHIFLQRSSLIAIVLLLTVYPSFCEAAGRKSSTELTDYFDNNNITVGAERFDAYLDMITDKKIAIATNHTALVRSANGYVHLVDTLLALGIQIEKIFSPEHGFRGTADAGERVYHSTDEQTGLHIVSLYGNYRKPADNDLKGLDMIVFDMQDVGARFYTYISTMHYVMEAAAENDIPVLILDRPNPNGHFVDGPLLDIKHQSFVGMHPVPIVHGMTIAEYALMINSEGWLKNNIKCDLHYIACEGYDHNSKYALPVRPSPNLPNMHSVYLYPSLCFFEGTNVSVGRGTDKPFQIYGSPLYTERGFSFTPESRPGATNPPHLNTKCYGKDLSKKSIQKLQQKARLDLSYLLDAYQKRSDTDKAFFNNFFERLAGTDELRQQIEARLSEEEIRFSWKSDLNQFMEIRSKYLIYPDFE